MSTRIKRIPATGSSWPKRRAAMRTAKRSAAPRSVTRKRARRNSLFHSSFCARSEPSDVSLRAPSEDLIRGLKMDPHASSGTAHSHTHHELSFLRKYIFSEDHKIIGIQFLFTSIIFLGLGGILAPLVRIQLAWPHAEIPIISQYFTDNGGRIFASFYNMLFTMHASVMIFFVIIPFLTGAFGNFTIPLMIGAPDMAFPKLNMMSYWVLWPGFVLISFSFFVDGGAASSGWTSYPTLSTFPMAAGEGLHSPAAPGSGHGQVFWLLSLICVGVGSMMGSVNYITTIINMRAPGMTLSRMPSTA